MCLVIEPINIFRMVLRLLKIALSAAFFMYLAAVLGMYVLQRDLMYFPTQKGLTPSQVGLSGVDVVTLETSDGEDIVVWYAPADDEQPTILFFHGNGGEVSDRRRRFATYQASGFGVLFVSWRGYGASTGAPSEAGILIDARTAYEWLISQGVEAISIIVVGESLGTGAAVRVAAEQQVGALILGAPYTATSDVAAEQYPWLPVGFLMKDQFRSIDHISNVSAPTLVLHGTADGVIPFHFGQALFDAVTAPKTFRTFVGQGHMMLFEDVTYAEEVAFINTVFHD